MSVAIDFERTLLQLLKEEPKIGATKILVQNNLESFEPKTVKSFNDHGDCKHQSEVYEHGFIVAPAVSLFVGITIGIGLASHSLIGRFV